MEDSKGAETADPAPQLQRSLATFDSQKTYRERVTHALKAALTTGEMVPGEMYSAPTLAAILGVSATPVREAMAELTRTGMVETVRNRGYRITEFSDEHLDDFTQLRSLVEVPTVAKIAKNSDPSVIDALRPLAVRIEEAAAKRDLLGYVEADNAFHERLLGLAGNPALVAIVMELRSKSRMYGLRGLAESGRLEESAREHSLILDRVKARDVAGTTEIMERHISHVRGIWAGRPELQCD